MIPIAKPYLTNEEAEAAAASILSGWVAQGPRVAEFEQRFCEYTGAKHAVAVSNCTTALHLSMIVAGIGPGDEVICPSMSYIATANCVKYSGAIPVFAEVLHDTYNIDPEHARSLITPRTKAILAAHQIGLPADIDALKAVCDEAGIMLIEDAACASGSAYKGRKIGCHSDLVCFSFHPRKVITTGEGGMIATSREDLRDRLKLLRSHGMSVDNRTRHTSEKIIFEDHLVLGYNYRMTDIQAAIGIKQLEKIDSIISERRKIAKRYEDSLGGIESVRLPSEPQGYFTNYQSYSIYLRSNCPVSRDELMQKLLADGISTRRGVMTSHRETAYRSEYSGVSLPVSEDACDRSILIPLYVPMNEKDVEYVISRLKKHLTD